MPSPNLLKPAPKTLFFSAAALQNLSAFGAPVTPGHMKHLLQQTKIVSAILLGMVNFTGVFSHLNVEIVAKHNPTLLDQTSYPSL